MDNPVQTKADELVELALRLGPEGEGLDLSDLDLELEDIVALRSLLSSRRRAIDIVNQALAVYWGDVFGKQKYIDDTHSWGLTRAKGKRLLDKSLWFKWLSTQTAEKLAAVIPPTAIKVTGLSPEERATFLDESPTTDRLSIGSKPK